MALAVAHGGCAPPETPRPDNVVLISLDTVRPDMLGHNGYPGPSSPALDALAAEGAIFETTLATSPWTLPSHGSLLTGLYAPQHGLKSMSKQLPASLTTLAESLSRQGFSTAGIVNSQLVGSRHGFHRGFDSFEVVPERARGDAPHRVIDRAVHWLAEPAHEPFFLFIHHYQAHSPYRAIARFRDGLVGPYTGPVDGNGEQLLRVRSGEMQLDDRDVAHLIELYAAGIRQVDEEVARLIEELARRGLLPRTLVVVTSDHGEEFLEHGGVLHGLTQYDELLRVPWILRGPGIAPGLRIAEPASLVDIMPTILGLLAVPPVPGLDGIDLSRQLRAGAQPGAAERLIFSDSDHRGNSEDLLASVRRGRFKLIHNRATGRSELFDLQADPAERTNLAASHPAQAEALERELQRFQAAPTTAPDSRELSPEEIEELRALGYLHDAQTPSPSAPDSPGRAGAGSPPGPPGSDPD